MALILPFDSKKSDACQFTDAGAIYDLPFDARGRPLQDRKSTRRIELQDYDRIELNFNTIDQRLGPGDVGAFFTRALEIDGNQLGIDGQCFHLIGKKEGQKPKWLARIRVYEITCKGETYWIIGDIQLNQLFQKIQLHRILVSLCVVFVCSEAFSPISGHVLWATGESQYNVKALGFSPLYVASVPEIPYIKELATRHTFKMTGIHRFHEAALPVHQENISDIFNAGCFELYPQDGKIKVFLGSELAMRLSLVLSETLNARFDDLAAVKKSPSNR